MKKTSLFPFYILLVILLMAGCKSKEGASMGSDVPTQARNIEQTLYNDMLQAYGSWETFVAKGEMSMGSLSSAFELRMIRNEAIQVSIRPILGMEIARVVVTNDYVYFYEKIGRTSSQASIEDISAKLPFTFNLNNIQSALLGRAFILGSDEIGAQNFRDFDFEVAMPQWIMTPKTTPHNVAYLFNCTNQYITQTSGRQVGTSRQFDCHYSNFDIIAGHCMPTTIEGVVKGSTKSFSAQLTYDTVSFDRETSIDTGSFRNYKESSLIDLIKTFLK